MTQPTSTPGLIIFLLSRKFDGHAQKVLRQNDRPYGMCIENRKKDGYVRKFILLFRGYSNTTFL